jgi:hypothetical protein
LRFKYQIGYSGFLPFNMKLTLPTASYDAEAGNAEDGLQTEGT